VVVATTSVGVTETALEDLELAGIHVEARTDAERHRRKLRTVPQREAVDWGARGAARSRAQKRRRCQARPRPRGLEPAWHASRQLGDADRARLVLPSIQEMRQKAVEPTWLLATSSSQDLAPRSTSQGVPTSDESKEIVPPTSSPSAMRSTIVRAGRRFGSTTPGGRPWSELEACSHA
jgi:hypothetical protein